MKYTHHFGERAADYLAFRPDYPVSLFDYLTGLIETREIAWDCGTGNGQAATALAHYFKHVIATDINQPQLDVAPKLANIRYYPWPAEKTHIESASIDLITIAQALHWFDFTRFYTEVNRVLKPNGVIAAWCYSLGDITPELNHIIHLLYSEILGENYWPKERYYIDEQYKTIPFPFQRVLPPPFQIEKTLYFDQLLGYLSTWSAIKEFEKRHNKNPIALIQADLKKAWGNLETTHIMRWPIHLLVGKIAG